MIIRRVLTLVATSAVAAMALSGCIGPSISGPPRVESTGWPSPLLAVGCDPLAPDSALATTFAEPLVVTDPGVDGALSSSGLPSTYGVRAMGGLACLWTNGTPLWDGSRLNPDHQRLAITVFPDAADEWQAFDREYSINAARAYSCDEEGDPISCVTDGILDNTWVQIVAIGPVSVEPAVALGFAAMSTLAYSPLNDSRETAPVGAPMPDSCEEIVGNAAVGEAVDLPGVVLAVEDTSVEFTSALTRRTSAASCVWVAGDQFGVGQLQTLPAGAWAWEELRSELEAGPIDIPGLGAGDEAWLRCADADEFCTVDLIVGGNWIQLSLWPAEDSLLALVDREVAVRELARVAVASLSA